MICVFPVYPNATCTHNRHQRTVESDRHVRRFWAHWSINADSMCSGEAHVPAPGCRRLTGALVHGFGHEDGSQSGPAGLRLPLANGHHRPPAGLCAGQFSGGPQRTAPYTTGPGRPAPRRVAGCPGGCPGRPIGRRSPSRRSGGPPPGVHRIRPPRTRMRTGARAHQPAHRGRPAPRTGLPGGRATTRPRAAPPDNPVGQRAGLMTASAAEPPSTPVRADHRSSHLPPLRLAAAAPGSSLRALRRRKYLAASAAQPAAIASPATSAPRLPPSCLSVATLPAP